jgi:hypothetical protein
MVVVDLDEVDFNNLADYCTIALLGKRRSGKTTWAKWLVQFIDPKCERFCTLCGNKDNIAEWRDIVPALFVHGKGLTLLSNLRDYQDRKCSEYSNNRLPIPIEHRLTLILDDCGSDKKFMYSDILKDILSNGRHYGMYVIILIQYLNQMHPVNRDQMDYIGVLHTTNTRNTEKLYNEYCSVCDRHTFSAVLKALTANRGLCWIDNTVSSERLCDCIFYKDQPDTPSLPVGGANCRRFSDMRFKSAKIQAGLNRLKELAYGGDTHMNQYTDGEDADVNAGFMSQLFDENLPDNKKQVVVHKRRVRR